MQQAVGPRGWNWRVRKGDASDTRTKTHTLMGGGGKFSVPLEERFAFLKLLAEEFFANDPASPFCTMAEALTPGLPFWFFLDLDTKYLCESDLTRTWLGENLVHVLGIIFEMVQGAFGEKQCTTMHIARSISLGSPEASSSIEATSGVHLVFPGCLCLDAGKASAIAGTIGVALDRIFRQNHDLLVAKDFEGDSETVWSKKIVDTSVFRTAFRMLYQRKEQGPLTEESRCYVPVGHIDSKGSHWKDASEYLPVSPEEAMENWSRMSVFATGLSEEAKAGPIAPITEMVLADPKTMDTGKGVFAALAEATKVWMGDPKAVLLKVVEKGACYILFTNVLFCPHYQREHQRKTQYLVLGKTTLKQRCSCKCAEKECAKWSLVLGGTPDHKQALREVRKMIWHSEAPARKSKQQKSDEVWANNHKDLAEGSASAPGTVPIHVPSDYVKETMDDLLSLDDETLGAGKW